MLHPHWKTVLMPIVILIGLAIAAGVLLAVIPHGRLAGPERIAVGALALIIAIAFTLAPLLRWRTTTYELTTRRFRLRYGILSRTGRDFPLIRISDVSFSHGLIDRILGCGRLVIESAGEHGQLVLNEIPTRQRCRPRCSSWSRTSRPGWPGKTASGIPVFSALWTA